MAFIGIVVPADVARVLAQVEVPGTKTHPADMHITMAYLGENTPNEQLIKASAACVIEAEKQSPFTVGVSRITSFPSGDTGIPVIGRIISPALHKFRESLCARMDSLGVEYSKKFAYSPHVTLSYSEEPFTDLDIKPMSWLVSRITLWGGDEGGERYVTEVDLGKHNA